MTKPKDNFDDVSLKIFKINCGIISDGEGAKKYIKGMDYMVMHGLQDFLHLSGEI